MIRRRVMLSVMVSCGVAACVFAAGAMAQTSRPAVQANLLQLMRGVMYPNANVLFAAQDDISKLPPADDPGTSPSVDRYGTEDGRRWRMPRWRYRRPRARSACQLACARTARRRLSKNADAMVEAGGTVSEACAACHDPLSRKAGRRQGSLSALVVLTDELVAGGHLLARPSSGGTHGSKTHHWYRAFGARHFRSGAGRRVLDRQGHSGGRRAARNSNRRPGRFQNPRRSRRSRYRRWDSPAGRSRPTTRLTKARETEDSTCRRIAGSDRLYALRRGSSQSIVAIANPRCNDSAKVVCEL